MIIKNLVFEGGGVKGIAYAGSVKALQETGVLSKIERVGGTSVGAIVSLMVALNMNAEQIEEVMKELDIKSFKDNKFFIIRDTYNLMKYFGWNRGEVFSKWCQRLIYEQTNKADLTFKELHERKQVGSAKDLYLIGANLSTGYSEVFSYETTPHLSLAEAVRISMSLPLFFSAYRNKITDDLYVDGGIFDNYPVDLFDDKSYMGLGEGYFFNPETLGFKLESSADLKVLKDGSKPRRIPIYNISEYIKALLSALLNNEDNKFRGNSIDKGRTVIIDSLNIRTTDFNLTNEQKQELFDSGYITTHDYLKGSETHGE